MAYKIFREAEQNIYFDRHTRADSVSMQLNKFFEKRM